MAIKYAVYKAPANISEVSEANLMKSNAVSAVISILNKTNIKL